MAECILTQPNLDLLPTELNDLAGLLDRDSASVDRSLNRVYSFLHEQKKKTTVKSTKRNLTFLKDYFFGRGENRLIENIPPQEIDFFSESFTSMLERRIEASMSQYNCSQLSVVWTGIYGITTVITL